MNLESEISLENPFANKVEENLFVKQINVSNFNEALEHIPSNSIILSDIDGTILPITSSLKIITANILKSIGSVVNFRPQIVKDIESRYSSFKNRLVSHFAEIREVLERKSNHPVTFVSNRVKSDSRIFHKFLDASWGTSFLNDLLKSSGIRNVHFGLDRQTSGMISVEGTWDKLISDLANTIEESQTINSYEKIQFVVIADNLNIIGEFASEQRFLKTLILKLSQSLNRNPEDFEGTCINIQKHKSLLNRFRVTDTKNLLESEL